MTDVLFLLGTVVAFGVFVLLLRGCEKIVGSEQLTLDTGPVDPDQADPDHAGPDQPGSPLAAELSGATS